MVQYREGSSSLPILEGKNVSVAYPQKLAIYNATLPVYTGEIHAIIGSSGCGKSSLLKVFNRMTDHVPGCKVTGNIIYQGKDIYSKDVDPADVRRQIGMLFQKPNPFPKSIYENVAFGPLTSGTPKSELPDIVEQSLRRASPVGRGEGMPQKKRP